MLRPDLAPEAGHESGAARHLRLLGLDLGEVRLQVPGLLKRGNVSEL